MDVISIYLRRITIFKTIELSTHTCQCASRNYPQVTMYVKKDGKTVKRTKRVHSIMAETFLGHVYDGSRKYVVDHIDNNPLNNNLKNLRIVTMKENNLKDRVKNK